MPIAAADAPATEAAENETFPLAEATDVLPDPEPAAATEPVPAPTLTAAPAKNGKAKAAPAGGKAKPAAAGKGGKAKPATATTVVTKAVSKAPKGEPADRPSGVTRTKDLPWSEKKVAVFKALKALKAVGQGSAVPAAKVVEKSGLTGRDVRHYVYHAMAAKLTGVATSEAVSGYVYYLTAKGAEVDPVKALKEQEAARKAAGK